MIDLPSCCIIKLIVTVILLAAAITAALLFLYHPEMFGVTVPADDPLYDKVIKPNVDKIKDKIENS